MNNTAKAVKKYHVPFAVYSLALAALVFGGGAFSDYRDQGEENSVRFVQVEADVLSNTEDIRSLKGNIKDIKDKVHDIDKEVGELEVKSEERHRAVTGALGRIEGLVRSLGRVKGSSRPGGRR